MALPFYNWSRTAASNATADATVNWAEGQAPSSVNDSARNMMASTAAFRDDIAGAILTTTSTTAYVLTSYQVFDTLAHMNGQMIAFTPHGTNTNTVGNDVTLNVDSLGAKPIRSQSGVALPNGSLIAGTPYIVLYNSSDAVFYLHNMTNPYSIPLGAGMDYWGSTTPNFAFAFPAGQAISRTTYATCFSLMGTTYGTGDGSTTFNLPDKTGRVSAMKEASASRLTSGSSGIDGATLGAAGGLQTAPLTTSLIPDLTSLNGAVSLSTSVTSTNWVASNANDSTAQSVGTGTAGVTVTTASGFTVSKLSSTGTAVGSVTVTSQSTGGSSPSHKNVQPTIVCNYIIRVI